LQENQEKIENQELDKKQTEPKNNQKTKAKKLKTRTYIVLAILILFILGAVIAYRANYLEALEIGEEYIQTFEQNVKYRINIWIANFVIVFLMVYITNKLIKKGLKEFFDEEKKELPKLPNKSLALIMALVTSTVVSKMFLQKVILFMNTALFGITDPIYNMDMGFYMFQAPLIRTTTILCSNTLNNLNNIHSSILSNSI